jgi:hypothetical protein
MKRTDILRALKLATSEELARELAKRRSRFAGGPPLNLEGTPEELEQRRIKREAMRKWRAKAAR